MVKSLSAYYIDVLPEAIKKILEQYNYVFNPSYLRYKKLHYLSIRVFDSTTNTILAMLYSWKDEANIKTINLTDFFYKKSKLLKVADPKIFIMNGNVWGTFNSGYTFKEKNCLGLFKIEEQAVTNYYYCNYSKRTNVEKNWGFYTVNDTMFSLYSVSPLTILKATKIENNQIVFEDYYKDENVNFSNYTIGTPLAKTEDGFFFIGHKKIVINGKRIYLGSPFMFKLDNKPLLIRNKKFVVHSFKAMLGAKHKFNKNLISCTYFSGIFIEKNNILLSYGINDVLWNTVLIKRNKLWS